MSRETATTFCQVIEYLRRKSYPRSASSAHTLRKHRFAYERHARNILTWCAAVNGSPLDVIALVANTAIAGRLPRAARVRSRNVARRDSRTHHAAPLGGGKG